MLWKPAWWHWASAFCCVLFVAFEVYGPALHGEFLFDDSYLPFLIPGVADAPLSAGLASAGSDDQLLAELPIFGS